jgi:hypothetical protein
MPPFAWEQARQAAGKLGPQMDPQPEFDWGFVPGDDPQTGSLTAEAGFPAIA